jgi:hypothetical protein
MHTGLLSYFSTPCLRASVVNCFFYDYEIFHNNKTLINLYPVELIRPFYLEIG